MLIFRGVNEGMAFSLWGFEKVLERLNLTFGFKRPAFDPSTDQPRNAFKFTTLFSYESVLQNQKTKWIYVHEIFAKRTYCKNCSFKICKIHA